MKIIAILLCSLSFVIAGYPQTWHITIHNHSEHPLFVTNVAASTGSWVKGTIPESINPHENVTIKGEGVSDDYYKQDFNFDGTILVKYQVELPGGASAHKMNVAVFPDSTSFGVSPGIYVSTDNYVNVRKGVINWTFCTDNLYSCGL